MIAGLHRIRAGLSPGSDPWARSRVILVEGKRRLKGRIILGNWADPRCCPASATDMAAELQNAATFPLRSCPLSLKDPNEIMEKCAIEILSFLHGSGAVGQAHH